MNMSVDVSDLLGKKDVTLPPVMLWNTGALGDMSSMGLVAQDTQDMFYLDCNYHYCAGWKARTCSEQSHMNAYYDF